MQEIQLVEELIEKNLKKPEGIVNKGGGRFKKVNGVYRDRNETHHNGINGSVQHDEGDEMYISEEGKHQNGARNTGVYDTKDDDLDSFLDTKLY